MSLGEFFETVRYIEWIYGVFNGTYSEGRQADSLLVLLIFPDIFCSLYFCQFYICCNLPPCIISGFCWYFLLIIFLGSIGFLLSCRLCLLCSTHLICCRVYFPICSCFFALFLSCHLLDMFVWFFVMAY